MEGLDKSGKPDLGDVVIEDFDRPISTVVEECKKEPNASLWDKIKKYFSKL